VVGPDAGLVSCSPIAATTTTATGSGLDRDVSACSNSPLD
jgi:hypothetical protein